MWQTVNKLRVHKHTHIHVNRCIHTYMQTFFSSINHQISGNNNAGEAIKPMRKTAGACEFFLENVV